MSNDTPPPVPHPRRPYVPGVYSYCDSWCDRCRFQDRCRVYSSRVRMEAALARGEDGRAAFLDDDNSEPVTPQPWHAILDEAAAQTPEEAATIQKRLEELDAMTDSDPLVAHALAYATESERLLPALRSTVASDLILATALDTSSWHDFLLYVKMTRAVGGQLDEDGDADDEPVQNDANGTAKLVRVLIRESRDAWEVLAQVGTPQHDEVARRMIATLEELDDLVDARFPHAMAFVRPGFDEEIAE